MKAVVAGGTDDFMLVQHLVLRGSQFEIGHALAQEAMASFVQAPSAADPILNRARRQWFERNWPQHYARMGGIGRRARRRPVRRPRDRD